MGSSTDWGSEVHHSDYENYVNARTSSYVSEFSAFLAFDGELNARDAHDAALLLAFDTTFGGVTGRNATWMDQHYDWSNSEFRNRAGESINFAVNYVADALHGFWLAAGQPIPEFQIPLFTYLVTIMTLVVATHSVRWKREVASEDPQRKNSAAETHQLHRNRRLIRSTSNALAASSK